MAGPKVTVIGAGSYFFGRKIIHCMATDAHLAGGTLALVDADARKLETMGRVASRAFKKTKCGVKLLASTKRREIMEGSDFVILTFSRGNMKYRGIEARVSKKHGITLSSADTIGPAGVFRALREIPEALAAAKDVLDLAPSAWVINYVNPTATIGIALARYAPRVKSFSICDGQREPYSSLNWLKLAGVLPAGAASIPPAILRDLDLRIAGVNHCTWILKFDFKGRDMLPALRDNLAALNPIEAANPSAHSKQRFNNHYSIRLFDLYGAFPTLTSHTKEYVPFFQGRGLAPVEPEPIAMFDAETRAGEMEDDWRLSERYASGKLSMQRFLETETSDLAADIIANMWAGLGRSFFVNSPNRGAVSNMAPDAFLELRCDLDISGPRPHPLGVMPPGLLSLQRRVLDAHELTAEAAVTGDKRILRRAIMTDPLCVSIEDGDAVIEELLELEKGILPRFWYKKGRRRQ